MACIMVVFWVLFLFVSIAEALFWLVIGSVREKLFELEEAFYGVCRMERLNSVFLGFGRGNLLCGTKCF